MAVRDDEIFQFWINNRIEKIPDARPKARTWLDDRRHMLQGYKGHGHIKSWTGFVIETRKTFNNQMFSKTKLDDGMPLDFKQIDNENFEVTVSLGVITYHKVKASNIAYYRYTAGDISKAQLVTKAFLFLLRKDPNILILVDF